MRIKIRSWSKTSPSMLRANMVLTGATRACCDRRRTPSWSIRGDACASAADSTCFGAGLHASAPRGSRMHTTGDAAAMQARCPLLSNPFPCSQILDVGSNTTPKLVRIERIQPNTGRTQPKPRRAQPRLGRTLPQSSTGRARPNIGRNRPLLGVAIDA